MQIHGWGGYPIIDAKILEPQTIESLKNSINENALIARGNGRSYGDSANSEIVLQTNNFKKILNFDKDKGLITCESGLIIKDILNLILPYGWFLNVTPGTSYATLGGLIASDIHGKNHHQAGTFSKYVDEITMLLGNGEVITCSSTKNSDLYFATCGGMGLTGIIISASIRLLKIKSNIISQKKIINRNLEETFEQFKLNAKSSYSVAWLDCTATGKNLGQSVLLLGDHAEKGSLKFNNIKPIKIPKNFPSFFINKWTTKTFNYIYYNKCKQNKQSSIELQNYFYPLDKISNWHRIYGKKGFIQYQIVVPIENGLKNMKIILDEIAQDGTGSFVAILKMFGKKNNNLLSFPLVGYTLAIEFKYSLNTIQLITKLDNLIADMGGKIYLTKDALITENTFKKMYPLWNIFQEVREKYSATGKFVSSQSKRIGLE